MADNMERLQAALVDRYRIEREIGSGGMAVVYLAEDLKHHRPVALKVFRPELAAVLGAERFLREIETTGRLTHPHILPLYDSGSVGEFLYYVMPYVEGESLRDRLEREKQLPLDDAVRVAREVADALDYAHRHDDIVHRDVKPENILLEAGHAVVADFGIARAIHRAGGEKLTSTGMTLGTPLYMSPEQADGDDHLDGRSDVYSLGCVLYEMLAGQVPFSGPTARAIQARHAFDPVPPLRSVRPGLPAEVEAVVTKALAKAPADRFATGARFNAALAEWVLSKGAPPVSATQADTQPISRGKKVSRVATALVAAAVVAAGAWVAWKLIQRPPPPSSPTAVAVLPFTVRGGDEYAYLGEGMVDLLSTSLDGAAELRRVDPHALLSWIRRQGGDELDPDRGRTVAQHFGAGLFVLGNVLELDGELRLSASLYEGGDQEAIAAAMFEGN